MKSIKLLIISAISFLMFVNCSSSRSLTDSQSSIVIHQKDGSTKEGLVIKREGEFLEYMDSQSHNKETVSISSIEKLSRSKVIYDFEANPIPDYAINEEKSMSKTLLYGGGGLVLGAAAGTGLGIAIVGAGTDLNPLISIAVLGLAGGWYFGSIGADNDYEDAVFEIRKKRYAVSKSKRDSEIEDEKRKIEESNKQKEELKKKIQEQNKN